MGEGEDAFCLGFTSRIVRYADGKARTYAKGFAVRRRPGRHVCHRRRRGVGQLPTARCTPSPRRARRMRSGGCPRPFRRQAGRLFGVRRGGFSGRGANISRIEWKRQRRRGRGRPQLEPLRSARAAPPADRGGRRRQRGVRGARPEGELLAVIPKNGEAQAVPSSIAAGPDGDHVRRRAGRGSRPGQGARVAHSRRRRHARRSTPPASPPSPAWPFGPDGSLYVTEFARNPARATSAASVVRVAPGGTRTRLGGGKLVAPQGAAVDANGAVCVSNYSVLPRETAKKPPHQGRRAARW